MCFCASNTHSNRSQISSCNIVNFCVLFFLQNACDRNYLYRSLCSNIIFLVIYYFIEKILLVSLYKVYFIHIILLSILQY